MRGGMTKGGSPPAAAAVGHFHPSLGRRVLWIEGPEDLEVVVSKTPHAMCIVPELRNEDSPDGWVVAGPSGDRVAVSVGEMLEKAAWCLENEVPEFLRGDPERAAQVAAVRGLLRSGRFTLVVQDLAVLPPTGDDSDATESLLLPPGRGDSQVPPLHRRPHQKWCNGACGGACHMPPPPHHHQPYCDGTCGDTCGVRSLVFDGPSPTMSYCRVHCPEREELERVLMEAYRVDPSRHTALVFPSGMAAIAGVLLSVLTGGTKCVGERFLPRRESVIVCGDELYSEVLPVVRYLEELLAGQLTAVSVDITDHTALLRVFEQHRTKVAVLYVETCTNPSGQFFDFSLLPHLRCHAPDLTVLCDNTWLTPVLFDPFAHGADVVVDSLTKYMSGGRCIGGSAVGNDHLMARVLTFVMRFGLFVGADHCRLFTATLKGLRERVVAAGRAAAECASHLERSPMVARVLHPSLETHPAHQLARRYLGEAGWPGIVWFHIRSGDMRWDVFAGGALQHAAEKSGRIEFKTSYGGAAARFDPWPQVGRSGQHDNVPRRNTGEEGVWVRIAMGHTQSISEVLQELDDLLEGHQPIYVDRVGSTVKESAP
eukprot:Hpha_TRINITY_DN6758_c1_g1::TRINITY_DN6758_c1_g1_i1::g.110982::m.110982